MVVRRTPSEKEHAWKVCIREEIGIVYAMYFAYILKSLKDGRYYYGSCHDIENRLLQHNSGKVKLTKGRRPFIVHYSETFTNRPEAFKREKFFKSIDGYKWLKGNNIV